MADIVNPQLLHTTTPKLHVIDCTHPSVSRMVSKRSARTPSPTGRIYMSSCREPDSVRLIAAIQMGHTRCLRNFLEEVCFPKSPSRQIPHSPARSLNCIIDRREVPKGDFDSITVKRQLVFTMSADPHSLLIPSNVYEFEQTSNPLIWAVDCNEWECLKIMCSLEIPAFVEKEILAHTSLYNPSQPQTVVRRVIGSSTRGLNSLSSVGNLNAENNSVCCSWHQENESQANSGFCTPTLESKLRPFAALMLSVSFATPNRNKGRAGQCLRSKSAHCSPQRQKYSTEPMSPGGRTGSPTVLSQTSSKNETNFPGEKYKTDCVILLGSKGDSGSPAKSTGRQLKRPTPYRLFWIRGSYTYQSLLDYFLAVGYEVVGTNWSSKSYPHDSQCDHCKLDFEYPEYPNYPVGPWDPRNDIFLQHFSQLENMLVASGVSVNRLDGVIAFNALSISAGRRLAGWCCHGVESDSTVYPSLDKQSDGLEFISEPLIEWRILGTLIDHGLNEFEWLEFLSPQQNLIGQALCVLSWPIYGWSLVESANAAIQRFPKKKYSNPQPGRVRRRSSSPVLLRCPLARFGATLKRQACLLLVNLWALGAFSSHHIVRAANSRVWERPTRSQSYTATMDGGDLRRIMLKTISGLPGSMAMDPLSLLRRWSYFQGLWRSALSGTPLPEEPPEIGYFSCFISSSRSPQLLRRKAQASIHTYAKEFKNDPNNKNHHKHQFQLKHSSFSDSRRYQPICLKLLSRRAIRRFLLNAQNARHGQNSGRGFQTQLKLTEGLSPPLRKFLGFFHSFEQLLSANLPEGLQAIIAAVSSEDPANFILP